MSWKEGALKILNDRIGSRTFTANEVTKVLLEYEGFAKGTAYRLLHDLAKDNMILKLGRGLYRFPNELELPGSSRIHSAPHSLGRDIGAPALTKIDKEARSTLEKRGIKFVITGASLLYPFFHHFPRKMIHLIYVIRGSGESAREALKENRLRCLLNPKRDEIIFALNEFKENDVFVIREISDFRGKSKGKADLECALVDTYFESTRNRMPLPPEEVGRIISNAFETNALNISHLMMMAERRGIRAELSSLVRELIPDLPGETPDIKNVKTTHVMAGLRDNR